ncbi:hypothetical protein [Cohnella terricola]|uniref:Uncharacterized protein n=1 Tax=Cohnella terricola TaxID=1289167 RepID=A0A559JKX2_9BACL|nr:hypothetical protein [Cohnella terricola]TVY00526.1 hypothetical protein FPZ45_10895 [Cohnella terricola]
MPANAENKTTNKRSYTLAALFAAIVVLATFVIMAYSKYILSEQSHTTDKGLRLAERYGYAMTFADRLHEGAESLLVAKTETERIRAVKAIAEGRLAGGETLGLFIEAAHLDSGLSRTEAAKPIMEAMNAVVGAESPLATIGEHEGPLTEEETVFLTNVRDGAAKMQETLFRFRPPSGEAGYRQMITVGEWRAPALEASKQLEELADVLAK